jgi:hypothetical protein
MGDGRPFSYLVRRRQHSGRLWQTGTGECGIPHGRSTEQENTMSKALFACVLVAFVAACAKKEKEVVYVEQPVTTEPVFTGKYK